MAKGNLAKCLDVVLEHEGGWSDHPKDPGGATMKGITLATYRRYKPNATKADLRAITTAEIETIYRDGFWKPVRGDALPVGLDLATFDPSVNSGPGRAAKWLQAAVGVKVDGDVGPDTIKAVLQADVRAAIVKLCAKRLSFMQGLKIWDTFKRGWSRRVADVEAKAVAMWLTFGGVVATRDAVKELEDAGKSADKTADTQTKGAGGTAAGGAGAGGADTLATGDVNWLLIVGIAVIVILIVAALLYKARVNRDRAAAYAAVAHTTRVNLTQAGLRPKS